MQSLVKYLNEGKIYRNYKNLIGKFIGIRNQEEFV